MNLKSVARLAPLAVFLLSVGAAAQEPVLQGYDLLETTVGTFEDLSNLNLLCPGCTVVGNPVVQLKGKPIENSSAITCAGDLGKTDTIVRRLQSTDPLLPGEQDTVPIEIVQLSLVSVQPIQVDCGGNLQNWMVMVNVAPGSPIGSMTIHKQHPNGGVFSSTLPVRPLLTFTRIDGPCPTVVCQAVGPIITFQSFGAPWVHHTQPLGFDVLEIPGCTTNFVPGVVQPEPGEPTPRELVVGFNENALLRAHGVLPPLPPKLVQQDCQEAVHFDFWLRNPGGKDNVPAIDALRFVNPRFVPPVPGYADSSIYFKSNSICNTDPLWTPCPTSWCRVNCDTLSPLYRREAWWFFPPVPVDSLAPPLDIVFSVPHEGCFAKPDSVWYEVDVECYFACALVDTGTFIFHCTPLNPPTPAPESPIEVRLKTSLGQNKPNPFRPTTTIDFHVDRAGEVKLSIYDVQGRLVRDLVRGYVDLGSHSVEWDGLDSNGNRVASGTYFYQLEAGELREARKMVYLR
jgi:hypothetical protein